MFDADRPIQSIEQDKLHRALFAKYLARCLLDHQEKENLVVGLHGGYGVGKTSLINLTIEELNYAASNMLDEDKPIILNFNPWEFSGQQQLMASFFRQLSSAIENDEFFTNSSHLLNLLEIYTSFYTHKPLAPMLRKKRSFLEDLAFEDEENIHAWDSGYNLKIVKEDLNTALSKQKHKIIVIIDNISQLPAGEIKQIFQLVKSVADLTNMAYLLSFDKHQVLRVLDRLNDDGKEFLDKVVQLPFEVPAISPQEIEVILADRLSPIVKLVPEGAWNSEYWTEVYQNSLRYFFQNTRDVTRYVNTLNFSYSRLRDLVNPVDFFAVTAIEVFAPNVYAGIRDNKDLFSDLLNDVYTLNDELIKKDRARCDEILARGKEVPYKPLLELVMNLFPRIRSLYQPNLIFFYSEATARKLRRISSSDLFDVYFRLSLQSGYITETEFKTILEQSADLQTFDRSLTRLNQDDRVILFLDKLDKRVLEQIPKNNIQAIVNSLLDNGDLFPQGISSPLKLDTLSRIHYIIHTLLRRFDNSEERFTLLQTAIADASKSLYSLVHELREQAREHSEESDTFLPLEFRDLTPNQLESLQKLVVSRIEAWAHNGTLNDHPQLLPILYAWRDWGAEEYSSYFVNQLTKSDRGLIAFLLVTLDKPIEQAITHYEKHASWEKYLDHINAFVSASQLQEHAKELFENDYFEKLREREQLALMIFLDLMKVPTRKFIRKTSV